MLVTLVVLVPSMAENETIGKGRDGKDAEEAAAQPGGT